MTTAGRGRREPTEPVVVMTIRFPVPVSTCATTCGGNGTGKGFVDRIEAQPPAEQPAERAFLRSLEPIPLLLCAQKCH